jgi:hypothetical protein
MNYKIAAFVTGVLTAGALMMPISASATDYWHWSAKERRWDHRANLRSDKQDLAEARRQLNYDRNHHASRRKIAEDEARVRDIERDIHADRAAIRH